jgi:ankyrin repeat protein
MKGFSALCLGALVAVATSAYAADSRVAAAARNQDTATVRALVKQRADVNAPDAEGATALLWAAHWNDVESVKLLLASGANPKTANRYGVTALHEAATVRSVPIMEALLRAGADPNAAYGEGETPLMTAARAGSLPAVKLLMVHGADINRAEKWRGQTALMWAAAENHADVAKILIEAGADVNLRTATYQFQNLIGGNGGIIHDRPMGGLTALMLAARQGAVDAGQILVGAGADLTAQEPQYGFTAMQTAIFNGHYGFAKMLIEKGADVNDGSLYIAVEMRNLATYTNRPNPPDTDGILNNSEMVALLLERGANPNLPYAKTIPPRQAQGNINVTPGATPLYRATRGMDLTSVKMLLAHGANPSLATKDHSTPLMAAAGLGAPRGGDEEVTEAGDKADPLDVLKALLEKGGDVNVANDAGMTAAHYAAQRGSERIIEFLASKGARFDVKNKQGRTAAELARGRAAVLITKLSQ